MVIQNYEKITYNDTMQTNSFKTNLNPSNSPAYKFLTRNKEKEIDGFVDHIIFVILPQIGINI